MRMRWRSSPMRASARRFGGSRAARRAFDLTESALRAGNALAGVLAAGARTSSGPVLSIGAWRREHSTCRVVQWKPPVHGKRRIRMPGHPRRRVRRRGGAKATEGSRCSGGGDRQPGRSTFLRGSLSLLAWIGDRAPRVHPALRAGIAANHKRNIELIRCGLRLRLPSMGGHPHPIAFPSLHFPESTPAAELVTSLFRSGSCGVQCTPCNLHARWVTRRSRRSS
jgi:hypothetical protein